MAAPSEHLAQQFGVELRRHAPFARMEPAHVERSVATTGCTASAAPLAGSRGQGR